MSGEGDGVWLTVKVGCEPAGRYGSCMVGSKAVMEHPKNTSQWGKITQPEYQAEHKENLDAVTCEAAEFPNRFHKHQITNCKVSS